jgi:hypothetical protein
MDDELRVGDRVLCRMKTQPPTEAFTGVIVRIVPGEKYPYVVTEPHVTDFTLTRDEIIRKIGGD